MRKRSIINVLTIVVLLVLMITACSKKDMATSTAQFTSKDMETTSVEASNGFDGSETSGTSAGTTASYDTVDGLNVTTSATSQEANLSSTSAISSEDNLTGYQDKIIRQISMNVETQEFDNLIKSIDKRIKDLGGYVESSQISGKSYMDSNNKRYGNIVARIPNASLDDFVTTVSDEANVINKEESTENVTLKYVDIESRKKSLEIEQERLFTLLEKTDTLDNIITLENRLTEIRYELQNFETQLRTYDNLVEYSTVTMNISEVERMTPVKPAKKTVWNRISTGFSDTMYHVSEGFKNILVWFVVNLPYLIIWAVIIAAGIIIGRKIYRNYQKKLNAPPTITPNMPNDATANMQTNIKPDIPAQRQNFNNNDSNHTSY